MAKKMTGIVAQFGTKGYGFITGDDNEKYFVHQKNVFNKSRLRSDTRVKFKVENSDKGLVAIDVKLEKVAEESLPLTDNDTPSHVWGFIGFSIDYCLLCFYCLNEKTVCPKFVSCNFYFWVLFNAC